METTFQVIVTVERVDVEGVSKTLRQIGELVVLGTFKTLEDAQSFVAALPLPQAPQPAEHTGSGPVNFDN